MKGHLKLLKNQLEEAVWQRQVAEQKLTWTLAERNEIEEQFMAAILEVQQKANLKQLVLEKKLETLEESLMIKGEYPEAASNSTTSTKAQPLQHDIQVNFSSKQPSKFIINGYSSQQELEQRVQTIVKLNFESGNENKDRSARSSVDNIETEGMNSVSNSKRQSYLESVASCSSLSVNSIRPSSNAIPSSGFSFKTKKSSIDSSLIHSYH